MARRAGPPHMRPMAGKLEGSCRGAQLLAALPLASGCGGVQSALAPAGPAAERIAGLFWASAAFFGLVWLAVVALALYAAHRRGTPLSGRNAHRLIVLAGAVFPTVVITGYLAYGLSLIPPLVAQAPEGSLRVLVAGERWWWRVRYLPPDGPGVDLANEIRLPVGEPVEFLLESPNVIHSFWIPSLGGKVDMIPGRVNRLTLVANRTGVFRGACAEYCGASHALMNFSVVVEERAAFDRWLASQASPARDPAGPQAARGREVFLANGCGACHAVRGTAADGTVGPDLTHVGGRRGIGADVLPNDPASLVRWIERTPAVKPEVHMPAYAMLPRADLEALAAYLGGLE